MSTPSPKKAAYYIHLDSLRGLAATFVALRHANWPNHLTTNNFIQHSGVFVDFFFVLSGIVISHVYNTIDTPAAFRLFFRRRFARLYPLQIATLLIVAAGFLVLYLLSHKAWNSISHIPQMQQLPLKFVLNIFLLNAHSIARSDGFNVPAWSIGAEFTCYTAYALICFYWSRGRNILFALLAIVGLLFMMSFKDVLTSFQSDFGFVRGIVGFSLGALVYSSASRRSEPLPHATLATVLLGAITLLAVTYSESFGWWATYCLPFLFAALLYLLMNPAPSVRSTLTIRPLVLIGTLSYSIYMLHFLVRWLFGAIAIAFFHVKYQKSHLVLPDTTGDILLVVYVISVFVASWLSYTYFENPIRLRFHGPSSRMINALSSSSSAQQGNTIMAEAGNTPPPT